MYCTVLPSSLMMYISGGCLCMGDSSFLKFVSVSLIPSSLVVMLNFSIKSLVRFGDMYWFWHDVESRSRISLDCISKSFWLIVCLFLKLKRPFESNFNHIQKTVRVNGIVIQKTTQCNQMCSISKLICFKNNVDGQS